MKRLNLCLLLLLGLMTMSFSAGKPYENLKTSNTGIEIRITISEAYYADLSNDGLDQDVFVKVILDFSGLDYNRYNMDYYITLTLPSGTSYTYLYLINTRLQMLNIDNYFYNHATEAGNYTVSVDLVLKTGGNFYTSENHVFDPPGGTSRPPIMFNLEVY